MERAENWNFPQVLTKEEAAQRQESPHHLSHITIGFQASVVKEGQLTSWCSVPFILLQLTNIHKLQWKEYSIDKNLSKFLQEGFNEEKMLFQKNVCVGEDTFTNASWI